MNRVLIIGPSGAGKSTFARKLKEKTGLPLFYLDMIYHRADKTTISDEEFKKELSKILVYDKWIIDGNYLKTLEKRIEYADTVLYLDLPVEECIKGVESRIGKKRQDMPWIEEEFDPEFKKWILDFPNKQTPKTYELLDKYKDKINIKIFKSRNEIDEYINSL